MRGVHASIVHGWTKRHMCSLTVPRTFFSGAQRATPTGSMTPGIFTLQLHRQGLNDTMGPEGLLPNMLVYELLPWFSGRPKHPTKFPYKTAIVATLSGTS